MGRVQQTARLIKEGCDPLQIANEFGVTLETVLGYLDRAVGEGVLRRSDIYFSFTPEQRAANRGYLELYADARHALGDMYEDVRRIELKLHTIIGSTLVSEFGDGELGWWRQGVPQPIRVKCQTRREEDPDEPCDAYCYTDLFDLLKILESNWSLFAAYMAAPYLADRRRLRDDFQRLNGIRNKIMHPIRGMIPCEDDFYFVRQVERDLGLS
jgi:hypothetical protein